MTLDAHALLVIHRRAEGWERLVALVLAAGAPRVPATALAEAGMVLTAAGGDQLDVLNLDRLVSTLKLTVVPFTEADWTRSVQTYADRRRTDGPGTARFGECLTAAVAARTGTAVVSGAE